MMSGYINDCFMIYASGVALLADDGKGLAI